MFQTSIEPRFASSSGHHLMAFDAARLPSSADMALCREKVRASTTCKILRFAEEAFRLPSPHAFRPAFTREDWLALASFCITTRLPSGFRVAMPGSADRTLRFVVEGSLSQEPTAHARYAGSRPAMLLPGAIQGEDTFVSSGANELDVRAFEDSLILELSFPRLGNLTEAHPAIASKLLRAAMAVVAACARTPEARHEFASH